MTEFQSPPGMGAVKKLQGPANVTALHTRFAVACLEVSLQAHMSDAWSLTNPRCLWEVAEPLGDGA
jgi:hypothetical protein